MKYFLFSATKGSKKDTLLFNSSTEKWFFKENNKKSLAKVYNKALQFGKQEDVDFVVLCHDDVIIESTDFLYRLQDLHRKYDVVGVAGTTSCTIQEPVLWHIMGGGFQGGNLRGAVSHGDATNKHMTSFGAFPGPVVLADGVFLSVSKTVFDKVTFDEKCPSKFHMYDLSFCLDASLAKLRVGIGDILITHASPGLREFTPEFLEGQKWFLSKYQQYAGKKLTV